MPREASSCQLARGKSLSKREEGELFQADKMACKNFEALLSHKSKLKRSAREIESQCVMAMEP